VYLLAPKEKRLPCAPQCLNMTQAECPEPLARSFGGGDRSARVFNAFQRVSRKDSNVFPISFLIFPTLGNVYSRPFLMTLGSSLYRPGRGLYPLSRHGRQTYISKAALYETACCLPGSRTNIFSLEIGLSLRRFLFKWALCHGKSPAIFSFLFIRLCVLRSVKEQFANRPAATVLSTLKVPLLRSPPKAVPLI